MRFSWPTDTKFTCLDLEVEDRSCPVCERRMSICDHRRHSIFTLQGPTQLICKLVHCPDASCASRPTTFSPLAETAITMPHWLVGWDVFCWIGYRRFSHHWSISQLCAELADTYQIPLSHDAVGYYIQRYQTMLAARHQDAQILAQDYRDVDGLILAIDGLQPEKGHETLYVVRELTLKRSLFAEALISSAASEVGRLFAKARQWAEQIGKPVRLWVSDKQDAFLTGIAAEFPGIPHRYCSNHFLRDLAKPILDADSHAKVKMRSKVRGLRTIERDVLQQQSETPAPNTATSGIEVPPLASTVPASDKPLDAAAGGAVSPIALTVPTNDKPLDADSQIVLDYCSAVRGILNSDQGGPLQPPGLRMAEALQDVHDSLQRNLEEKKGGPLTTNSNVWPTASTVACPPSKKRRRSFANR
jgi:hypothetical protein